MKSSLTLLSLALTLLAGHAAEIVAWKVPLSKFVENGLKADGIVRRASAPEASPFFKAGDELWDIKGVDVKIRKETSPPLEWAIWNATSSRLVVKAENEGIWQLCYRMGISDLPTQYRFKAEVLEVTADVRPPDNQSKPTLVTSWVVPFGDFNFSPVDDPQKFGAFGRAYASEDNRSVWIKIDASFRYGEKARMIVNSTLVLPDGKSGWIAREYDGKKGMDLRITASIELEDGTPASEVMLIQKGTISEAIHVDRVGVKRHRIGEKRWLAFQSINANFVSAVFGQGCEFDESTLQSKDVREKLGGAETQVPALISRWFEGPVRDISGKMKEWKVIHADSSTFAGYDPNSNRIFLYSGSTEELDNYENLFQMLDGGMGKTVEATLHGIGETRIMMGDRSSGSIELRDDKDNLIRRIQMDSNFSEDKNSVEVRLDYIDLSDSRRKGEFKTTVTSKVGEPVELKGVSSGNADPLSIRLSASAKDPLK